MNNIEFIVLTCDKYLDTRVLSIKKSWGLEQNIKFLTDSKSKNFEIIGFNTQKNYNGIFDKYVEFFKTYNFRNYDYYFFTDDDTFVNLTNLKKLELPPKETPFCVGRMLCLNPDGTDLWGNQTGTNISQINGENTNLPLYYPSGGSGFIISQKGCLLLQEYLNSSNNIPYCRFGDVSLGFWLRNSNVKFIPNSNFWWDTHENLSNNSWEEYISDKDVITFHYVGEKLMFEYHRKYNSNDNI
jgi:hypothetical protein